jgi:hypothetical protein
MKNRLEASNLTKLVLNIILAIVIKEDGQPDEIIMGTP